MAEGYPEAPAHWTRLKDAPDRWPPHGQFRIIAYLSIAIGRPWVEYVVGDFDHQGRAQHQASVESSASGWDTKVFDDRGLCVFVCRQKPAADFRRPLAVTKFAEIITTPRRPRRKPYKRRMK